MAHKRGRGRHADRCAHTSTAGYDDDALNRPHHCCRTPIAPGALARRRLHVAPAASSCSTTVASELLPGADAEAVQDVASRVSRSMRSTLTGYIKLSYVSLTCYLAPIKRLSDSESA